MLGLATAGYFILVAIALRFFYVAARNSKNEYDDLED